MKALTNREEIQMLLKIPVRFRRSAVVGAMLAAAAFVAGAPPSEARVTRIIIDTTAPITGQAIPYEMLTGRAFGELNPNDPHNTLITDIGLAPRNANGNVEYVASFVIRKPVDMTQASGLLWHDVPNRGGNVNFSNDLFEARDTHLLSGWQGDNAGATTVPANASSLTPITPVNNHWV